LTPLAGIGGTPTDQYTLLVPDIKYSDMLLLVKFMYGGEVTVPLKQLGDLQDLIQLLQLDPGGIPSASGSSSGGKFVIENIQDSGAPVESANSISATINNVINMGVGASGSGLRSRNNVNHVSLKCRRVYATMSSSITEL